MSGAALPIPKEKANKVRGLLGPMVEDDTPHNRVLSRVLIGKSTDGQDNPVD